MIFIDAGHIKNNLKNSFGDDLVNYGELMGHIISKLTPTYTHLENIRIYYYDAESEIKNPGSMHFNELYLKSIKKIKGFEDRLGTLKTTKKRRDSGGFKQKGVDTLMAIDVLSKAYQDQYDIAILVTGDEDFLPVVDYVKNTGKRIYGVYFENLFSQDLDDKFDNSFIISNDWLLDQNLRKKIRIEFNKQVCESSILIDVKINVFLEQTQFSAFISLIGIDKDYKILNVNTIDLSNDIQQQLNQSNPETSVNIEINKRLKIVKQEYPLLFLLISSRQDFLRGATFYLNFKEDYLYRVIN